MFTKPRSGGDLGCCPGSHDSGSRETDELRGAGPRLIHAATTTTTTTDNSTLSSLALASQTRRARSEDGQNYWKD